MKHENLITISGMAETVGFEPTPDFSALGFQDRSLQPLGYVSTVEAEISLTVLAWIFASFVHVYHQRKCHLFFCSVATGGFSFLDWLHQEENRKVLPFDSHGPHHLLVYAGEAIDEAGDFRGSCLG